MQDKIKLNFLNLSIGEERKEKVLENVKSNITFKGANLWILACAIVIASVGLNVNSTAVIIGAMLISPLMGPIVGAGFALALHDFQLFKKSCKNLVVATLVSLLVASLYFYLSPFKEANSELLARTSPTIFDVLIAFFGGVVGVIAITRVEKGNPIPGVAIATALMPPLCTAGFGIAIGEFTYFIGAIYLYAINCVFICVSTFLILKYLNYKPIQVVNRRYEKQIRYSISGLILVMVIPSFYLAYSLLQDYKYNQKVDQFIANEFTSKGNTLIYKKTNLETAPRQIELAFLNKKFDEKETTSLNSKLKVYGLLNTKIVIKQDTKDLKGEILNEIGLKNREMSEKDVLINNLKAELDAYKQSKSALLQELSILFPEMTNVSIGKHEKVVGTDSIQQVTVVVYEATTKTKIDTNKVVKWLQHKLKTTAIELVRKS